MLQTPKRRHDDHVWFPLEDKDHKHDIFLDLLNTFSVLKAMILRGKPPLQKNSRLGLPGDFCRDPFTRS